MPETPILRTVLGVVTHADGRVTCGLHVRNAAGVLALVDTPEASPACGEPLDHPTPDEEPA